MTNPKDQIFNEDKSIADLTSYRRQLLEVLSEAVGYELNEVLLGLEPEEAWSSHAKGIFAKYRKLSDEISRLNSQRCSRQLTRFMSGVSDDEDMADGMMRWWMNRY